MAELTFTQAASRFPKIGTDEVGKGDFFGPLVVSAVFMKNPEMTGDLRILDSKSLSDSAIRANAPLLMQILKHSVVKILPSKYNQLYERFHNINLILGWAHAQAIKNLLDEGVRPELILIDKFGPPSRVLHHFHGDEPKGRILFFTHAEKDKAVACASMISRLVFLNEMEKLSHQAGIAIPLGAGPLVDQAAQKLAARLGVENLGMFVKLHFRNFASLKKKSPPQD